MSQVLTQKKSNSSYNMRKVLMIDPLGHNYPNKNTEAVSTNTCSSTNMSSTRIMEDLQSNQQKVIIAVNYIDGQIVLLHHTQ